jgi:hypothetical protein
VVINAELAIFGDCLDKSKVTFPSHFKLTIADYEVFSKLREIETRLRMAMSPYDLWTLRVSMEFGGVFVSIAE